MKLYLHIAKKISGRSGIALASVALSVAIVLIATSVADGFKKEIGESASGFSGDIMLTIPGQDISTYLYPVDVDSALLCAISDISSVKSVNGVAYCPGMLKTEGNVHGALFKGVDSAYSLSFYEKFLCEGRLPAFSGSGKPSDEVMISRRLASLLGLSCGEKIKAYFIGESVRARRFLITGIYDIRMEDVDEKLILCDLQHVQILNEWEDGEVSCVEIALTNGRRAVTSFLRSRTADEIDDLMSEYIADDDENGGLSVQMIDDVYPHLFDWLSLLDMNVLIVLALMFIVAGFNMISGLLIILFQNISTIGLLKSLGMTTSGVCRIFLCKAGLIVLKGMVIGNVIALSLLEIQERFQVMELSQENYFTDHVPVCIDPAKIISMNIIAFAVMMLIMMIPSGFISRISPANTVKAE